MAIGGSIIASSPHPSVWFHLTLVRIRIVSTFPGWAFADKVPSTPLRTEWLKISPNDHGEILWKELLCYRGSIILTGQIVFLCACNLSYLTSINHRYDMKCFHIKVCIQWNIIWYKSVISSFPLTVSRMVVIVQASTYDGISSVIASRVLVWLNFKNVPFISYYSWKVVCLKYCVALSIGLYKGSFKQMDVPLFIHLKIGVYFNYIFRWFLDCMRYFKTIIMVVDWWHTSCFCIHYKIYVRIRL